jgi:hypothetical protein
MADDLRDQIRPSSPSHSATSSSSHSSVAPIRVPASSPEPTYKTGTTPHFKDYPMSARDRQRMDEDIAEQASMDADALESGLSASELQRQMLAETLNRDPPHADGIDGVRPHLHAFELEDDPPANLKFPLRSTVVAVFLLLVGLTCLIIGLVHTITGADSVFAFVLIGAILIIPGGYQCWVIWNAWRRVPGFSFAQLSAYEG